MAIEYYGLAMVLTFSVESSTQQVKLIPTRTNDMYAMARTSQTNIMLQLQHNVNMRVYTKCNVKTIKMLKICPVNTEDQKLMLIGTYTTVICMFYTTGNLTNLGFPAIKHHTLSMHANY